MIKTFEPQTPEQAFQGSLYQVGRIGTFREFAPLCVYRMTLFALPLFGLILLLK